MLFKFARTNMIDDRSYSNSYWVYLDNGISARDGCGHKYLYLGRIIGNEFGWQEVDDMDMTRSIDTTIFSTKEEAAERLYNLNFIEKL